MELRHLRYFAAVAEDLSFRRAVRRLHLSHTSATCDLVVVAVTLRHRLFKASTFSKLGAPGLTDFRNDTFLAFLPEVSPAHLHWIRSLPGNQRI